jgi:biopolymer transport protein TolQ
MSVLNYLSQSSTINLIVIATLSIYFVSILSIFIYRYRVINRRLQIESDTLASLYTSSDNTPDSRSVFYTYITRNKGVEEKVLKAAISDTIRVSTRGLTQLSIIASTSPFIGLLGTVVGILDSFGKLAHLKSASLSVVAPAISEALVATAVGIFVAIFAYSFNLLLKRKVYELHSTLESISEILLSRSR